MKAAIALAGLVLVGACASQPQAPREPTSAMTVVATSTVLADFVSQVGGSRVTAEALVPLGGDVIAYDPSPSDIYAATHRDLLVMNGLGLDDWLPNDANPVLHLAEDLPGATYLSAGGSRNPHLWLNVAHARGYASLIATELIQLDPAGKPTYDANLTTFDSELVALDGWIRTQIAPLTPDQRRVVSLDDAFAYFADAYGLELTRVGAEDLASAIENNHARALLSNARLDDEPIQAIVDEARIGWAKDLYDDSLGDPPIDNYEALMRWDTNQITGALK